MKTCPICGKTFEPTGWSGRRYCSNRCASRAYNRKKITVTLDNETMERLKELADRCDMPLATMAKVALKEGLTHLTDLIKLQLSASDAP